jgi:peptide deformylase
VSVREILTVGHPVLRERAREVTRAELAASETQRLIDDLIETVRYLDGDGVEHGELKRGLTAGTFQHECDHLDGILFLDRVTDPRSFTSWEQFERFHRAAFVERITELVARVGS